MTGYFREVIMVFVIVLIHEMGHACAAAYFKWNIKKIELLPFGGVVEMNETANRPIKEELIVILSGPIQHIWLIGLSFLLLPTSFWTINDHEIFIWHNLVIFCFNLLPIWPLDGGRLIFLGCSYLWPYKQAYLRSLQISFGCLMTITFIAKWITPFHLNLWVVIIFLFISNFIQWKQRHFAMIRFLLHRPKRNQKRLKRKIICCHPKMNIREVIDLFQRDCFHIITLNHRLAVDETTILEKYFRQNRINEPITIFFDDRFV